MLEKNIAIKNASGIHARPASMLVKEAAKFSADIIIVKNDSEYNAKSIMNVMSMGAKHGDEIKIKVSGSDEKEALEAITTLVEGGFGE
ncbi:MAG: HPr family phosphocarrier protein [Clostridiaceae bacterium]|nr:HPr family phosphocarrier protein [Clostridiaceae bacterium]